MIYCAKVIKSGDDQGTWYVSPAYTRNDGLPAPDILALSSDSIVPAVGDVVLCVEGINPFDHSSVRSFDNNGGSNPVIIATYAQILETLCDMIIRGKVTLGQGTKKMVLGNPLETWAQAKDAELQALYTWAATGIAPGPTGGINPFPGTPALVNWDTNTLSANHKLD
jgi:hypothetical protein